MLRYILLTLMLLLSTAVQAIDFEERQAVARVFQKAKINGTFVLYDVTQQRLLGYNRARAQTRFLPASTFKIPNSLIGLETGVVSSVDEVFWHYDGGPTFLDSWKKDMNLREAIKVSNVLAYQTLARRIGLENMQANVNKLDYGNRDIGKKVDDFWLVGPIKISAVEQTTFLARLAQQQLPFSKNNQLNVRDILQQESGQNWTLYAKTGWTGNAPNSIGWYVGWVEQNGKIYSFALNIDVPESSMLNKRIELAKASLKALGLL
jgi:beta-lactamase class D